MPNPSETPESANDDPGDAPSFKDEDGSAPALDIPVDEDWFGRPVMPIPSKTPEGADDDPGDERTIEEEDESDPALDIAVGEDWSKDQILLTILRQLYQAIELHIKDGDFLPSQELEFAMMNARDQIDWS